MNYILVEWIHDLPDEPSLLLSELDEQQNEVRKIEIFPNGKVGYASSGIEVGGTRLSIEPIPDLSEIASDPQFKPRYISKEEFEKFWNENVIR